MSKLYKKYLELKNSYPTTIFLFKSGIFYLALDKDAELLAEKLNFKLVNLNQEVLKCGFPVNKLPYYANRIKNLNLNFEVVDLENNSSLNYDDYSNNQKVKDIIGTLRELDANNITLKQSFDLLYKLSEDAKNIVSK